MQAIVVGSGGQLTLREVPPPEPAPSEALVRIEAVSLNRGEATRALAAREGTRLGWDLAGVVDRAAADGSGPPAGVCVVFGASDGGETVIDAKSFYMSGPKTVTGLALFDEIKTREPAGRGLAVLLSMVADGRLVPEIAVQRPWTEVAAAAEGLRQRQHGGKAVLLIGSGA